MFTRQDTLFLKGISILLIAIHNFCHWLPRAVNENEYVFHLSDSQKLLHYVAELQPHVVLNLFSHYGHYGVPVFLFLSGYGLVCKYEYAHHQSITAFKFIGGHIRKLWRLMIPALLLFTITQFLFRGSFEKDPIWALRLITFTANLFPTVNMILGPWWFFSLILQCYLLYRLLFLPFRSSLWLWGFTAATLIVQMLLYAEDVHFTWEGTSIYALEYYRYNAVGHLLPFAFGIEAARRKWRFPLYWSILGTILTLISAFNVWLWFFSPIFAVMAVIPWATPLRDTKFYFHMQKWGSLSAAVFAFHPIVRHYLILPACKAVLIHQPILVYGVICLYLVLTLSISKIYTTATVYLLQRKS